MATQLYIVGHRHDPHAGSSRTNQVFPFIVVGRSGSQAIPNFSGFEFLSPPHYRFPLRTHAPAFGPVAVYPVERHIRAARRTGELLGEMGLNKGAIVDNDARSHGVTAHRLSEIGITKMQSHRWQTVAKWPGN